MSEDFEKAYKELAQMDIPDLWDRIEAGISETSTPEEGDLSKSSMELKAEKKAAFAVLMKQKALLIAAVFCAVLILPAALTMITHPLRSGQKESAAELNSAAAKDTAVRIDNAAEAKGETAAGAAEAGVEESAEESVLQAAEEEKTAATSSEAAFDADLDGMMADASCDAGGSAELENATDESRGTGGSAADGRQGTDGSAADGSQGAGGSVTGKSQGTGGSAADGRPDAEKALAGSKEMESAKKEAAVEEMQNSMNKAPVSGSGLSLEEGTLLMGVIVEKIEKTGSNILDKGENEEPGALYTAVVQKDSSLLLKEGEEIRLLLPAYSSLGLGEGKESQYEISIVYSPRGNYDFVLKTGTTP